MPWPSSVNAVAGPGRSMTRGAAFGSPKTVTVAGSDGAAPGARTASWWMPSSKVAAAARAANGRTAPAGICDGGGDTAATAGSMVRGADLNVLDEHPATAASKRATPRKPP